MVSLWEAAPSPKGSHAPPSIKRPVVTCRVPKKVPAAPTTSLPKLWYISCFAFKTWSRVGAPPSNGGRLRCTLSDDEVAATSGLRGGMLERKFLRECVKKPPAEVGGLVLIHPLGPLKDGPAHSDVSVQALGGTLCAFFKISFSRGWGPAFRGWRALTLTWRAAPSSPARCLPHTPTLTEHSLTHSTH